MSRDEENIDDPIHDGTGQGPAGPHKRGNQPPTDADAEDILFEPTEPGGEGGESGEQFGARQQFAEDSRTRWGGHAMDADEIGIPIESEPGYMSSEDDLSVHDEEAELELVDDERDLEADPVVEAEAEAELADAHAEGGDEHGDVLGLPADEDLVLDEEPAVEDTIYTDAADAVLEEGAAADAEGEFFVLDEAERSGSLLHDEPLPADSYPVEEGWEPVGAEGEGGEQWLEGESTGDPIAEGTESLDLEPQHAELEEQYYEEVGPEVVAAAPRRQGRLVRMMASMAAAVFVVGAGAVVVLRPEWLGLHFEPQLVERVQVARPNTENRVAPPPAPTVRERPTPTPTNPLVKKDPTPPTLPVVPWPTPDPVAPQPTDPVAVTPPQPQDPTPVVVVDPTQRQQPVAGTGTDVPRYLPVSDQMWIGEFDDHGRRVAEWAQVRVGAKAFAQLQNGNYFVGSVKAVNSDALILDVPAGEVTLPRTDLMKVATLDSEEYAELQQVTTGFLRLNNRNRLVGAILKSVVDDNYVLQMRSDRIVVPRAAVEQVVSQPGMDGLKFSATGDEEEWLRGIAQQQLHAMSTGIPASPGGEGRLKKAPERQPQKNALPVPQAERRAPVELPGR